MSRPRSGKKRTMEKSFLARLKRWRGPAIILMAAIFAMTPLFIDGPSWNGDFNFHLVNWIDAQYSMSKGLLYPHWADSPNFAAGEPRFVFYPPISWMIGAMLGALLPWSAVSIAFSILLLAGTGLAVRALAKEALPDGPATLAGCAAIFFGYALFNVYKHSDFAEMCGGIWIPLLLLFGLRRRNPPGNFWQRTFDGSAVPLTLVVAGTWLSNVPLAIMACYLLVAVATVSAFVEKSWVPAVRVAVCTIGGIGLASFYLIPALWEREWVSVQNALEPINVRVENNWLFAHHADPQLARYDVFLQLVSVVAVTMLAVAFAGGVVAWIRGVVPGKRNWWLPLALIPPAVLFLLLPVSQPVWNVLPELRLLQFPWRWLVVLEAPMSICFAVAVWFDRKALRIPLIAACAVAFVGITFAAPVWWYLAPGSRMSSTEESWRQGIGVLGKPEFAPPGARSPQLDLMVDPNGGSLRNEEGDVREDLLAQAHLQVVPVACLLNTPPNDAGEQGTGSAPAWNGTPSSCDSSSWQELYVGLTSDPSASIAPRPAPERRWIAGVAQHSGYLIMRLRFYPAWNVKVNGAPVRAVAERDRGLMAVPVPRGNVQVTVDWMTIGDVLAGRLFSGFALFMVAGMYLFERQQLRAVANTGGTSRRVVQVSRM